MLNETKDVGVALGTQEAARSATACASSAAAEFKRWSAGRKKQVALRLLREESVDALSRELAVPIFRLEQWRDCALAAIDAGFQGARPGRRPQGSRRLVPAQRGMRLCYTVRSRRAATR